MSDAEYIGVLEAGREADKLVIAKLEAENKALLESNRVALAEAYRCGYEAAKQEKK